MSFIVVTGLFPLAAILPAVPALAQSSTSAAAHRLEGLRVLAARRVTVEGQYGIEVNFEAPSAERLLHFTIGAVGRHLTVMDQGRRLAALRLLDLLKDGHILLTGDLDRQIVDALFAPDATVDLAVE